MVSIVLKFANLEITIQFLNHHKLNKRFLEGFVVLCHETLIND